MFTASQTKASVSAKYGRSTPRSSLKVKPSAGGPSTQAYRSYRSPAASSSYSYRTGKYDSSQNRRWGSARNPARQVGFERPVSVKGGWGWSSGLGLKTRWVEKKYKGGRTSTSHRISGYWL
jgi:hypothetical protein